MAPECELSPLRHDQSSRLPSAALVPAGDSHDGTTAEQSWGGEEEEEVGVDEAEPIMRRKTCKTPGPKREE